MYGIVLTALLAQPGACGPGGCGQAPTRPAARVLFQPGPVRQAVRHRPMILRRILFHGRGR